MQPVRYSYFGHTRRGCQRCTEETHFGLSKVARIVEFGGAVKPAVGRAGQENGEDDKARGPLAQRQRAMGFHSLPKATLCLVSGTRKLKLCQINTL